MTLVKICGLRTIGHALAAADAGADMIGLIFAASRRQVNPEQAAMIAEAVRARPHARRVSIIGLFVNETPEHMLAIVRQCRLDAIELSGDEASEVASHLPGIALFKAIRLDGAPSEAGWLDADQRPTCAYWSMPMYPARMVGPACWPIGAARPSWHTNDRSCWPVA